jgi:hypothetical protein
MPLVVMVIAEHAVLTSGQPPDLSTPSPPPTPLHRPICHLDPAWKLFRRPNPTLRPQHRCSFRRFTLPPCSVSPSFVNRVHLAAPAWIRFLHYPPCHQVPPCHPNHHQRYCRVPPSLTNYPPRQRYRAPALTSRLHLRRCRAPALTNALHPSPSHRWT